MPGQLKKRFSCLQSPLLQQFLPVRKKLQKTSDIYHKILCHLGWIHNQNNEIEKQAAVQALKTISSGVSKQKKQQFAAKKSPGSVIFFEKLT
ncbi:hypothetical protein [Thalassomonas sp. RHCl1]|uniref:hypothetical protein n=1 Tax=Thalassomonas sp. RHCl1 TaxID=2995320 RepID=UPI00248CB563|nr:hypothetical protein [Thalassomonas sp. RHCl1]